VADAISDFDLRDTGLNDESGVNGWCEGRRRNPYPTVPNGGDSKRALRSSPTERGSFRRKGGSCADRRRGG